MDPHRLVSLDSLGQSSDGLIPTVDAAGAARAANEAPAIGELPADRAAPQTPSKRHVGLTEWVYHECVMSKDGRGLGLDVAEDPDGLKVTGIVPGGAAERTNLWHVGDVIVSINGMLVRGKPAAARIDLLRAAQGEIRFGVIAHAYTQGGAYKAAGASTVATEYFFDDGIIVKGEDGFGLDIAVVDEEGVLITEVVPGGAADRAGFVRANDRIVMINDKPVVGLSRLEVVERLRGLSGEVKFSILAANHMHPRHRPQAGTDEDAGPSAAAAAASTVASSPAATGDGRSCVVS